MGRFVVEPCVAVKWFVPEEHSREASRLLDGGHDLLAPETIYAEVGRLLGKKARLGEVSTAECAEILAALKAVPISTEDSGRLIEAGLEVATAMDRPLVDGLGIAMAVRQGCRIVTAQPGLRSAAAETPFGARIKWVGDIR